ncbi:magnesium transporter [Archaeoglobus neptunius]|uniref:magnesium transporter n=1 Tax=Archaeoglobus neptunius TaxID=2798580 RepID=UPI001926DF88|nr:magnesium transporter [Archaeoglobus neptunius]
MIRVGNRVRQLFLGSLPALLLCLLFDFVAGGVLGAYFEKIMNSYPILFVIIPGLMANRGNIFGAMASRLTTLLHLGEMRPRFGDENIARNVLLSLLLSLLPVLVLWTVGVIKIHQLVFSVLLIVLASTVISSIVMGYSTAAATIIPFRRGIDPDAVAAPIVTSVGDVVTLPLLILFVLIFEQSLPLFYISLFAAFLIPAFLMIKIRFREDEKKIFREVLGILIVTSAISSVSGSLFEQYSKLIYSSILFSVVYPSIADSTGNLGAIVGAKTSTRIHLGEVKGTIDRETVIDIISYTFLGFFIGILINLLGILVARLTIGKNVWLIWQFVFLYPLLLLITMFMAYYISRIFVRIGLDPDNGTVPMITTLADLMSMTFIIGIIHLI